MLHAGREGVLHSARFVKSRKKLQKMKSDIDNTAIIEPLTKHRHNR